MLLATGCSGVTRIYNAAKEPEIEDLQNFLNSAGAMISGAGTNTVTITPVKRFHDCEYTVMHDRIEAITFICACASAGGEVRLKRTNYKHICTTLTILEKMGVKIVKYPDSIVVLTNKKLKCPEFVTTRPYPGFPTDAQSLIMSLMCHSDGAGLITENIFENRLEHAQQLQKMGADITICDNRAFVRGTALNGADTVACDLRSGAALVVAGLGCEGLTTVANCCYIDRGYYEFTNKLLNIGAKVERVQT
jgi:UDP-N-acetylglucosamine 1-carboxyvinyltransferase